MGRPRILAIAAVIAGMVVLVAAVAALCSDDYCFTTQHALAWCFR
jgi:hypothetical protein